MSIIIKPIITEKITKDGELFNRFGFVVAKKANKIEIKKAIERSFGVSVLNVNTMICRADRTTKFTKSGMITGKTSSYKKAIVTLKEGDSIDFYTNI